MIGVVIMLVIYLAVIGAIVAGGWKTFEKAGLPGWAFLVPIYNLYLLWQMTGKPFNWFIFCLIPCLNFVFAVLILLEVAKAYGKGTGTGIALLFGVGWLMLGFGDAKYQGPALQQGVPTQIPK